MKVLLCGLLVSSVAFAMSNAPKKTLPVKKGEVMAKKEAAKKETAKKIDALTKKEEDCDDKAKKKVEITPESISLSGNTGCSLDEAKH